MKFARVFLLVGAVTAVAVLGGATVAPAQAQQEDCRFFGETGYYVCDAFLEFFDTRGGLEIFGYPLTDAFVDLDRGLLVQYFQRARMEWHPANSAPYQVQLGLLVDDLAYDFPGALAETIPPVNTPLRHYFPETNHVVSFAFLKYFREHGGLDVFGYPRSEVVLQGGYMVQYFQRAVMEWHPEAVSGPEMRLLNLGELYVDRFHIQPGPARAEIKRLDVSASVRHTPGDESGMQTVFVYVYDQRWEAVPGAAVAGVVRLESGDQACAFAPTDDTGFTRCDLAVQDLSPGKRVIIKVTAALGDLVAVTETCFFPWW